jgi:hypothetical protein
MPAAAERGVRTAEVRRVSPSRRMRQSHPESNRYRRKGEAQTGLPFASVSVRYDGLLGEDNAG